MLRNRATTLLITTGAVGALVLLMVGALFPAVGGSMTVIVSAGSMRAM